MTCTSMCTKYEYGGQVEDEIGKTYTHDRWKVHIISWLECQKGRDDLEDLFMMNSEHIKFRECFLSCLPISCKKELMIKIYKV